MSDGPLQRDRAEPTNAPPSNLPLPLHYRRAIRILLRYAVVMGICALAAGVAYQESSKRLSWDLAQDGRRSEATLRLALTHGHFFLLGVLLPLAFAGMLVLARAAGGREIGTRSIAWLLYGYLPHATASLALLIVKGYHFLLAGYRGDFDVRSTQESFFGGHRLLRHSVYGYVHFAMGLGLVVFLVAIWRSLGSRPHDRS